MKRQERCCWNGWIEAPKRARSVVSVSGLQVGKTASLRDEKGQDGTTAPPRETHRSKTLFTSSNVLSHRVSFFFIFVSRELL